MSTVSYVREIAVLQLFQCMKKDGSRITTRRRFLKTSSAAAAVLIGDLKFLAPLSHAAAVDTNVDPGLIRFGPDMDPLVRLIRATPRNKCVAVFVNQLKGGLSYRRFLAALFLCASETGDLHQLAQVYSAHRVSSNARIEERLLPLFWALDRIKKGHEHPSPEYAIRKLNGQLPKPSNAESVFRTGMIQSDGPQAELGAVALARSQGARHAMNVLWEFASRNVSGTLGHLPIGLANAWRTSDAIGWEHAEPALRYLTREIGRFRADKTHAPNLERVERSVPRLPADWTAATSSLPVTLELYRLLRDGDVSASCDLICSSLVSGKAKAGAVWDAISLAAADLIFRYSKGGNVIGGALIHVVTSTNALRFGFRLVTDPRIRLINLLQAAGVTAGQFVLQAKKDGRLRKMSLVDDLEGTAGAGAGGGVNTTVEQVFELLPYKGDMYQQKSPDERVASDNACRMVFGLLNDPKNERVFLQTARSFLCVKASLDPHDIKYPAAAFEDASLVSPKWRPYLLASSVHALHGAKSEDSKVLVQASEAMG